MSRLGGLVGLLGLLGLLVACEDNEHPFDDSWAVQCSAPEFPGVHAVFMHPRLLDDSGKRRAYLGYVEVPGLVPFPDVWIWQVEVDDRDGSAATVAFDHVPLPEGYDPETTAFRALDLDVATYEENEETTAATMTGTCAWGDGTGDLQAVQGDDCDTCFTCDTPGLPGPGSLASLGVLIALRRRAPGARTPAMRVAPGDVR